MLLIFYTLFFSFSFSQIEYCTTENLTNSRSIYSIGDTLSVEDQNILFPVCNGSGDYSTGDSFSFSDLNGNENGEDYKITIISMNATW
tara:strand:+ start:450 stop:713 length:264 start_codon:yes stop_codon:yes gene_type:complete